MPSIEEEMRLSRKAAMDITKAPSASRKVDFSGLSTTGGRKYNPDYISYINDRLSVPSMTREKRASILANIIEESGGDPFALDSTGQFYGLLQWGQDRYTPSGETDPYKELDRQTQYIIDSAANTTDRVSWTHGGKGSGYNSYKDAIADFDSDDLDRVMRGYTIGHVRPTGKNDSYQNRLKVAKQIISLDGFQ